MKSFVSHGHEFHLYTYDPVEDLPEGITVKDAGTIISRDALFTDAYGSWGCFSDFFRYKLLYDKGGCWIDMDCVCLQPFRISSEYCFSSEYDNEREVQINCGFIKAPAGAPLLEECLNYIELRGLKNMQWGELGPDFFCKVVAKHKLEEHARTPEVFCPINYYDMYQLIGEYTYEPAPQTLAIHCWNELWRRSYLDKNARYHPTSVYELMKQRYL
nr:glycosyltransferase [uncultured Chitinophaga sp.]